MKILWRSVLLASLFVLPSSCGSERVVEREVPSDPDDPDDPDDPGDGLNFNQVQAVLKTYCEECHASARFMTELPVLVNSSVKQRLWTKNMPPDYARLPMPDDARQAVIDFIENN